MSQVYTNIQIPVILIYMDQKKKIVIFHYHLKRGGVTSVIKEQVQALKNDHDLLIITGESPEEFIHDDVSVIPELGYSKITDNKISPEESAARILKTIEKYFGTQCDILHLHNPILAKNHNLIKIIKIISGKGVNVFLQIHDFAEDGRPLSYFKDEYPVDVHYGVINSRDYFYLLNSGLTEKGLHLLPNCIRQLDTDDTVHKDNNLVLYPVRAIRRKNIGEAILLSLFLKENDRIGITLPALNNNDLKSYEEWKHFVKSNFMKVDFDLGIRYNFNDLIEKSKFFITTSITEGFGFAYLEPWICGRRLFGRKIVDICKDFTMNDINLDDLYEELHVPSEMIDKSYYFNKLKSELRAAEKYYGISINHDSFLNYFSGKYSSDSIDFGMLSEKMQSEVITKTIRSKSIRRKILEFNPKLKLLSDDIDNHNPVTSNIDAIRRYYSRETYKKRLNEIYDNIYNTKIRQKPDKKRLLEKFLQPEHFYLLKWGSYDG